MSEKDRWCVENSEPYTEEKLAELKAEVEANPLAFISCHVALRLLANIEQLKAREEE